MVENAALRFYEQIASHLTCDIHLARETVAGIVDTLAQQYLQTISELGLEAITAVRAGDRKEFYTATTKVQGKIVYSGNSTEKLPFLRTLANIEFAPNETKSPRVVSLDIKYEDFEHYRQTLSNNFHVGMTSGSRYPLQLKGEIEANAEGVACRMNLWKWDNLLSLDKPSPKKDRLAQRLFSLAEEIQNVAAGLGLESFGNPMNGLSVEDRIRLRGEALSTRYEFGFSYSGKGAAGYDLGITFPGEHHNLKALVRRLLFHDILGGSKVLPLSLPPLFMLQGMGEALGQQRQLKNESEPTPATATS